MSSLVDFLRHWSAYRRFTRLPRGERRIVVYSESAQDWHHFRPVLEQRLEAAGVRLAVLLNDSPGTPGAPAKPEQGSGKGPTPETSPATSPVQPAAPGKPAPAGGGGASGVNPAGSGKP